MAARLSDSQKEKRRLNPATDFQFVCAVGIAEFLLEVGFFGLDCELVERPCTNRCQDAYPRVGKQNSEADAEQHHQQVHRMSCETIWAKNNNFRCG